MSSMMGSTHERKLSTAVLGEMNRWRISFLRTSLTLVVPSNGTMSHSADETWDLRMLMAALIHSECSAQLRKRAEVDFITLPRSWKTKPPP
jgi:hypothetical protein